MPGLPIAFFILAAIAVATALGMLLSRNTVYSALLLVLNFVTIAVLYLILGAPFIALSQVTVYAGSIMVLFLFVIMLLGVERLPESDNLRWQPVVAIPLALILVAEFAFNLFQWTGRITPVADLPANYGDPAAVGEMLFSQFTLPFEVTAVILLTATIGAIILAKTEKPSPGQAIRRTAAAASQAPSGALSSTHKEAPAAVQEEAIKQK